MLVYRPDSSGVLRREFFSSELGPVKNVTRPLAGRILAWTWTQKGYSGGILGEKTDED